MARHSRSLCVRSRRCNCAEQSGPPLDQYTRRDPRERGQQGMRNFGGRVAVVTGAASGIGLGLAERLASEGMKLVLADIEGPALATAAHRLRSSGADVVDVQCDVARAEHVERLATRAVEAFGAVHVVCN